MNDKMHEEWYQRYEDMRFPVRITEQSMPCLVAPHHHKKSAEFIVISRGCAEAQIGSESYVMQEGDVAFIPRYTHHRVDAVESGSRLIGLCFDYSILETPYGSMLPFLLESLCANMTGVYPASSPFAKKAYPLLQRILREYGEREYGYEWAIYGDVYTISCLFLRDLAKEQGVRLGEIIRGMQRLRPALERIDERYAEPLSVASLAADLGLSEDHFSRCFREIMKQPPIKYINDLRIRRSLQYLAGGVISISEISERVGFCSPSYYNRVFHAVMGMSPMQYRKNGVRLEVRAHRAPSAVKK